MALCFHMISGVQRFLHSLHILARHGCEFWNIHNWNDIICCGPSLFHKKKRSGPDCRVTLAGL